MHDGQQLCPGSRLPRSEFGCQPPVLLYRDDPQAAGEQLLGEAPPPRSDLEHDVAGRGLERVDDLREELRVAEEVLPERRPPAHTLRITRVRSSAAGAPPVKPARSA